MTKCKQCGSTIIGRSDKKFCDAYCRNTFNNKNDSEHEKLIKNTNSIIRKNRTILKTASPLGKTTIRKKYLDMQGFDFRFFSSIFRTNAGNIYRLCYDYGYTKVADDKILIINYQSYMDRDPSFMEEIK